jgi:hypothetical protein
MRRLAGLDRLDRLGDVFEEIAKPTPVLPGCEPTTVAAEFPKRR